ncbi:hypothetical protein [Algirhabdus cladophorae]|uniref:hypothetical protein n=1 Tax=Algirhabdus cladophorae TaxID=3377108 RepID=UPI003B8495F6
MSAAATPVAGSFRDPVNKVYALSKDGTTRILRGINADALQNFLSLQEQGFYQKAQSRGWVVKTDLLNAEDPDAAQILRDGWAGVLEHAEVPFVSYPYEWSFSMLKDAALLQLSLIEAALEEGWTMKDATPFNIQFISARPVFIDIPSYEPRVAGEPWVGYRQFCSMFLTPLLLKAHLNMDHLPLLRSYIDGIPPTEAAKFFRGLARLKKGVLSHILLPARVENAILSRERDRAPAKKRDAGKQSDAMVIGLVQSLRRLVRSLKSPITHTDWSQYDKTHSYEDADFQAKKAFVQKHASSQNFGHVWDIGCNTGTFSRLCAETADQVISVDGDHNAIEQLYLRETEQDTSNILPLVLNLANISPSQGWGGSERAAFDQRTKPGLVIALALIHHVRISSNIPNVMFLKWLHSLGSQVIIEFVNRSDEMVVKLLTNKKEQYHDYNITQFEAELAPLFDIVDRQPLKDGDREIFMLKPKG